MISRWSPETLALQVTPALLGAAVEAAEAQKLSAGLTLAGPPGRLTLN